MTGNITQQPTPSLLAGIESEFVILQGGIELLLLVLTNNDLNLSSGLQISQIRHLSRVFLLITALIG